jgi:hypothetical protein
MSAGDPTPGHYVYKPIKQWGPALDGCINWLPYSRRTWQPAIKLPEILPDHNLGPKRPASTTGVGLPAIYRLMMAAPGNRSLITTIPPAGIRRLHQTNWQSFTVEVLHQGAWYMIAILEMIRQHDRLIWELDAGVRHQEPSYLPRLANPAPVGDEIELINRYNTIKPAASPENTIRQ